MRILSAVWCICSRLLEGRRMLQGGTCIFSGDEAQLLDQAAEIAEKKLKCKARFGSAPVFTEGFNRARFSNLHADAR